MAVIIMTLENCDYLNVCDNMIVMNPKNSPAETL